MKRSPREIIIAGSLFIVTLTTSTFAGFQHALTKELLTSYASDPSNLGTVDFWAMFLDHWTLGLPFSFALIGILLAHELGHFFTGKLHRIDVSFPYFIPAPTLIGTFGAVIRMRGHLPHRKGLIDVGASGPIVGFIIAVPLYIWGMANSQVIQGPELEQAGLFLGDSLLTLGVQWLVLGPLPEGADVLLHPVAFAAWIGFFVTFLNLIPMGQLDGGHILYALSPERYVLITRMFFVVLLVLGAIGWTGWFFWAAFAIFMGVSRHPRPMFLEPRLEPSRQGIGWVSVVIFLLTFVPNPFMLV